MAEQTAITVVGYKVDTASQQAVIASTKQVEASIKNVSLASTELGRNGPSVDAVNSRFAEMKLRLADVKAEVTAVGDTTRLLVGNLQDVEQADAIRELGGSFGFMAREEGNALAAAERLAAKLHEIGATKDEIALASAAFTEAAQGAASGPGFASLGPIGQKLKALPSVQIPGTGGLGTDSVANVLRLAPILDKVGEKIPLITTATEALIPVIGTTAAGFAGMGLTIAAVAIPIAVVVIAIKSFIDALAAQKKMVEDTVNALGEDTDKRLQQVEIIRSASSEQIKDTIEVAKAKLAEIQIEKTAREAFLQDIQNQYAALGSALDPAKRAALGEAGQAAQQSIDNLTQRAQELQTVIDDSTNTVLPAIEAREKETAVIEAQTAAQQQWIQSSIAAVQATQQTEIQIAQLKRSGSEKQLEDLKTSNQDQQTAIRNSITALTNLRDTFAEGSEAYQTYQQQIDSAAGQLGILQGALSQLSDASVENAVKLNDATEKTRQNNEKIVGIYNDYTTQVDSINEKFAEDSANLEQKRIDKLVDIQDKAVEAAEKLLATLENKQEDAARNLGRSLDDLGTKQQDKTLQEQIDFARKELEAEKNLQAKIADIRRRGDEAIFESGLDRNFAEVARQRRQTVQQISEATNQASQEKAARLEAFKAKQADEQNQFIAERQQRITQYQRQLEDAQIAYNRDYQLATQNRNKALAQAQTDYEKSIQQLKTSRDNELSLKYVYAQQELALVKQTADVRMQIFKNELAAALAFANGNTAVGAPGGSGGGGSISATPFALGGTISPLRVARVNEGGSSGRESYSNSRGTVSLPGYGLFMPLREGGRVNRGGDRPNVSISMPININTGADPRAVGQIIPALRPMVDERIAYAFEQYSGGG